VEKCKGLVAMGAAASVLTSLAYHHWLMSCEAYYIGFVAIIVIATLITIYHKQIVIWLMPAANWMHECVLLHAC
jgi:hypothetical protein